jgi:TonB-dependent SusC/RagA subfamily outer membrane receptor
MVATMTHYTLRSLGTLAMVMLVAACGGGSGAPAGEAPAPRPARDVAATSDDLTRNPNVPIEQVLQQKVPGLVVTRAEDGSIAMRIRGTSSLAGNNEPLYVVDGVVIQAGPGGSLTGINPYDIATIRVLKDPTELTMYGSRGANGVIVIKTKKPNQ